MSYSTQCRVERATKKWRIREFLASKNMTQRDLANEIGLSEERVWHTINGVANSFKVLDWLRENGAPESLICDPRIKGMKKAV